eukprot:3092064-Rhodomonas_salina.4
MEGPRKRLEKEVQGVEGEERVHEDGWGGNVTAHEPGQPVPISFMVMKNVPWSVAIQLSQGLSYSKGHIRKRTQHRLNYCRQLVQIIVMVLVSSVHELAHAA